MCFFCITISFFLYILCLYLKGDFTHETHFFLHIFLFWISNLERSLILNVILMALNLVVLKAKKTKNKKKIWKPQLQYLFLETPRAVLCRNYFYFYWTLPPAPEDRLVLLTLWYKQWWLSCTFLLVQVCRKNDVHQRKNISIRGELLPKIHFCHIVCATCLKVYAICWSIYFIQQMSVIKQSGLRATDTTVL